MGGSLRFGAVIPTMVLLIGCQAQVTGPTLMTQETGQPVIPQKVGLYVTPDARGYAVDAYTMHFDVGPRLASDVSEEFGRAFRSLTLVNGPAPGDRSLDAVIVVEKPNLTVTNPNLAVVDEKLEVPFSVYNARGEKTGSFPIQVRTSGGVLTDMSYVFATFYGDIA